MGARPRGGSPRGAPARAGIVGSVVLPILGAVPDGAIVLFSGLGANAAQQVAVGVGALAGSTIMLLTVPWFLSIIAGRVDYDARGNPQYKRPAGAPPDWKKLSSPAGSFGERAQRSVLHTGVGIGTTARFTARIMLATSLVRCWACVAAGPVLLAAHRPARPRRRRTL